MPPFIDRGDGGRDGRDGLTAPTDGSYEMKEGSLGDERAAKGDVAMAEAMEVEVGGGGGGGVGDGNMEADMCPDVSFSDLSDVADISKADGGFIAKVN